jgi:hypothetical protein
MANDVFDVATNLHIDYFNSSISSWVAIEADSYEVDIDRGIDVENGVFAQPSTGTATVKLVKKTLNDFLGTPGYKAGDIFRIEYQPLPDTSAVYNSLFQGYIQNVSMSYINESQTLEITITANDVMRFAMNANLPTYSVAGTTTQRSFRSIMSGLFTAINAASPYPVFLSALGAGASSTVQRAFTWQNTAGGEILSRFQNAELGWIWASRLDYNTVNYLARTDVATIKAITYNSANPTVSNVHYTNLIANGNFEVDTSGWGGGTSVTLTRVTSTFYSGIASMRVSTSSTAGAAYNFLTTTTMSLNAGEKLRASIWARNESNSATARTEIYFYNSGGTLLSTELGPYTNINGTTWTEISNTGVAPAGTVRAVMGVRMQKTAAAIASVFTDLAKLQNLTNISTNHYCLDNIVLAYDSDLLVNKAKVTEIGGGTSAIASNTASITANGQHAGSYSVEYDVAGSPTTLANLATRIADSASIKQIQQVTVPAIRDDGKASNIANLDIGSTLQVEFAQDPLAPLQVVSMVSRINHNITPQHWEINIGLWRGI